MTVQFEPRIFGERRCLREASEPQKEAMRTLLCDDMRWQFCMLGDLVIGANVYHPAVYIYADGKIENVFGVQ